MSTASLSLLHGAKKEAVDQELTKAPKSTKATKTDKAPAPEPEPEPVTETETAIEIENMNSEELDALVEEHGVETPTEWSGWDADQKRSWLNEQFSDGEAAEPAADQPGEPQAAEVTTAEEAPAEPVAAQAEEPAPKAKKSKKSTAVALTKPTMEGEIVGPDILQDMVHEIENLKESDARDLVLTLAEASEVNMFKLGGVLSVIQAHGWFEPYASFREFVEKQHGIAYRKAVYWVSIYNALAEAKVSWEKVKGIGWTKLKEIALIINSENADHWIEIAKNSTTLTLAEAVKNAQAKNAPALEDQTSKTVTTITFKVHEDQKATVRAAIDRAKEQSGTDVDTVALEYICMDFLGGQSMLTKIKELGLEKALGIIEQAWPEAEINVTLGEEAEEAA